MSDNLSAKISESTLSNEMLITIERDLDYLRLILNEKATVEEVQQFRSILRARRLSFQNSTFQPFHPKIIVAVEAIIDSKTAPSQIEK